MTQLHAQPYDTSATGFYFNSLEEFQAEMAKARNDYGDPVEEFEIQFIDGDPIDCDLANAWGINQAIIGPYFEAVEAWEENDKIKFIIAVGDGGYSFQAETVSPDAFDIDIYNVNSMRELAEQFVEEGLFGEIPENLTCYIDYDAIACDLAVDYSETEVAGERLIYRLA